MLGNRPVLTHDPLISCLRSDGNAGDIPLVDVLDHLESMGLLNSKCLGESTEQ
jgi:hypothetical protein